MKFINTFVLSLILKIIFCLLFSYNILASQNITLGVEKIHGLILDDKLSEETILKKIKKYEKTHTTEDFYLKIYDNQYNDGLYPIHLAAQKGYLNLVKYFLKIDQDLVNVLSTNNKFSLLHMAAMSNNSDLISLLIFKKNEVNGQSRGGLTPLHLAVAHDSEEIVKVLMHEGADPNLRTQTTKVSALEMAKKRGNSKIIILLKNIEQ